MLKQGIIVDLGLLGKIYPSCSSGWFEKAEDMKLENVKPGLFYRPSDDVEGAIKSAKLVWSKGEDEEDEDDEGGGSTPTPGPDSGGGGGSDPDSGVGSDDSGGDSGGGGGTGPGGDAD